MSWTVAQRRLASMACKAAGIDDDRRRLMLMQIRRSIHEGKPTFTSPKLTNDDFDRFMSWIEGAAGGRVLDFKPEHFIGKAAGPNQRLFWKAEQLAQGVDAAGGIIRQATGGAADRLDQLDGQQLYKVVEALKAVHTRRDREQELEPAMTQQEIPF